MARGHKTGGRKAGTKNRRTVERERLAAQLAADTPPELVADAVHKLGKDVLASYMLTFDQMAQDAKRQGDHAAFRQYAALAVETAHKLAPYQSPTFRAVLLQAPPPSIERRRFKLTISQGPRPPWLAYDRD